MNPILIIKTGALGDVLRTTAILPGLHACHPGARVTWLTARAALDLVRLHPLIAECVALDLTAADELAAIRERLAHTEWTRVISLDDEEPLCALASALKCQRLSGAWLRPDGGRAYTADVAPWFDMGLLSVHGKAEADRLKVVNQRSHPELLCAMLGIAMGKPQLVLGKDNERRADEFARRQRLYAHGRVIGLNTGAGGRWHSKMLTVERTLELARQLDRALAPNPTFVLFGGPDERERNARIAAGLREHVRLVDTGVDNALLDFAALVGACDLLVTSDSLALHVALARDVRCVAFFAPTSAAEIELYGLGEKVVSSAPDYCSYRPDADTSSLTPERLAEAVLRQLAVLPARRVEVR